VHKSAAQQARERLAAMGVHSRMPVQAMQTYALRRPPGPAFWRENLGCEQVDCDALRHGWVTRVDEATELGQRQAHYIRREAGRLFDEEREPSGLAAFTFPAGQPCFRDGAHRAQLEREPLYVVRRGDYRKDLGTTRTHTRSEHWTEDFAENQDKIQTARDRG
jgi:hypothetical protein